MPNQQDRIKGTRPSMAVGPFGYLLYYHKNIENLRSQVGRLEDMKNDIQRSVATATRRGEEIRSEVRNWLDRVTMITAEAQTLLQNDVTVSRRCWLRYRLSKQAKTKMEVVTRLIDVGGFDHVSNPPSLTCPEFMPNDDYFAFQSTRLAFDEVMKSLQDDSVNMIGIYGMGGVGKTALVEKIGKDVKVNKHFDEVLMAVVSRTPNIKLIQDLLVKMLGLNLTETYSETMRAVRLFDTLNGLLKEKRILVILDDIWSELELADIGIPSSGNNKNLKIVLTTRRQQVCRLMGCQKKVALDVLSESDSWNLFRANAGDIVDSSTLNVVAREVARECCGLPIALVTIGRELRNNRDLQQWKQAVFELRNASPTYIEGVDKIVYASHKLSYDFLPCEESREMFLLCCLFPENYNIEMETLVHYAVGKRLFQGLIANTMDKVRSRAYQVIQNIKDSCLLLESYDKDHIKVHDVVRDVGIFIASENGKSIAKASIGLKEWPRGMVLELCTSISLMYNDIRELPHGLNCSSLNILLLQGNENLREIPDAFFERMGSLEVLDLSYTKISEFPASIKQLRNLRTLRAKGTKFDISILGKLKNLEILDLENSKVFLLQSIEIGHMSNLRVLNLNGCYQLTDSICNFISSLSQLEELYLLPSYGWWDEGKDIEWKSLSRLSILDIGIKDVKELPKELCVRLKKFHIATIAPYTDEFFKRSDTTLCFSAEDHFVGAIKVLLERTRDLQFLGSQCWRNVILDLDDLGGGLQFLKYLDVRECDGVEYLISAREVIDYLPNLESLEILHLKELKEICHGLLPQTRCFRKLSSLFVGECDNLRTVVPFNLMTKLLNLENLEVAECKQMEAIFDSNHEGISFPQEDVSWLSTLTDLRLEDMDELQKIWKGPTRLICLRNLKRIHVWHCGKLREIFSPTLSQTLLQLEDLEIMDCAEVEEVVTRQEEEITVVEVVIGQEEEITAVDDIIFPKLNSIRLVDLWKLRSFSSSRYNFKFPALETLTLRNCDEMKTFTSGHVSTPKLKLLKLNGEDYSEAPWLDDQNHTIQYFYGTKQSDEFSEMCLLCGLFPKDHDIEIETLVHYAVGKRLFQGPIENTMGEERSRAYEVVQKIKDSYSQLESNKKDCKVHGVVRELDIPIAFANNTSIAKASIGLKEWPRRMMTEHCTSISLMYNDIQELPSGLNCPKLKILLLQGNKNLREIPDAFFEGMESLEVLDLSYTKVSAFPASMKLLRNLRTLRGKDMELVDISILGMLKNLEILDLEGLELLRLPTEIGHLSNLRVLNLNGCSQLSDSMLNFISSLSQLEELYLLTDERLDVKKIEWKSLSRLNILHSRIKDVGVLPKELCATLNKFRIATATCIYHSSVARFGRRARRLYLSRYPSSLARFERSDTAMFVNVKGPFVGGIKVLLQKTSALELWGSQCSRNVILDLEELGGGLQCVQYLDVSGHGGVDYVMRASDIEVIRFPNLQSLGIWGMKDLKEICHDLHPQTRCIWKLSSLTVQYCDNLQTVVPFNLLTKLLNLEDVAVIGCEKVEAIFDSNHEGVSFPKEDVPLLSTLTNFTLESMNKLQKIWKGPTQLVSICNLKHITVWNCGKLMEIFSPTLSQTLLQLEDLEIKDCAELKEVVTGQEEEIKVVDFPKLNSIRLSHLGNLACFCSGRFTFQFPVLENLIVQNCYKMETFTFGRISTPKLKFLKRDNEDYPQDHWPKDSINSIMHKLYDTNPARGLQSEESEDDNPM